MQKHRAYHFLATGEVIGPRELKIKALERDRAQRQRELEERLETVEHLGIGELKVGCAQHPHLFRFCLLPMFILMGLCSIWMAFIRFVRRTVESVLRSAIHACFDLCRESLKTVVAGQLGNGIC